MWFMPFGWLSGMAEYDQDFTKGADPCPASTAEYVCKEYDVVDERGRHLAIMRVLINRKDIGKSVEKTIGWTISAHAIDERAVRAKK